MASEPNEVDLFAAVLDMAEAERPEFLQQACGDDVELRERLDRYLRAHRADKGPLDTNPPDLCHVMTDLITDCRVGSQVGPYKLLEQIGAGGMGVVFMAEQRKPVKRTVALKIIKPGMDTQQVVARFESERQALALMNHSNIAKVLDAGTTESGLPYFAMELVRGIPVTEYCDEHRYETRQRLELFILICRAVQHAHLKGIIHRDLKPTNVLVELHDVLPVPKVIDFGVAKATNQSLTDHSLHTGFSQMIGTPVYMSPEQAQLNGLDVDTRSDVYSLGVILYELLTGETPFDRETFRLAGFDEMRRMIREDEPVRPSDKISTLAAEKATTVSSRRKTDRRSLSSVVRNELDWIVMKALEKDRTRRFESASALAVDVQRYLDGESVHACPPTLAYRLRKTLSRHKGFLTTAGLLIGTMIVGSSLAVWQAAAARDEAVRASAAQERAEVQTEISVALAKRAQQATDDALRATDKALRATQGESIQRQLAQRTLYVSDTRLAASQVKAGEHSDAFASLMNQFPESLEENHRGWEWYYLLSQAHQAKLSWFASNQDVRSIDWSPDGKRIATASGDGTATIWDVTDGSRTRQLREGSGSKQGISWHPSSTLLAWGEGATSCIWDEATDEITRLKGNFRSTWTICWNHVGNAIVSGGIPISEPSSPDSVDNLLLWKRVDGHWSVAARASFPWNITSAEWSFDDRFISVAGDTKPSKIVNAETLEIVSAHEEHGQASSWHPTQNLLAIGLNSGECAIFDFDSSTEVVRFDAHLGRVFDVQWSDDGRWLGTCSEAGAVKIWKVADWSMLASYSGHDGSACEISWHPNSMQLASAGADGIVHVWPLQLATSRYELDAAEGGGFAWTADGLIRTLERGNRVVDRDVYSGKTIRSVDLPSDGRQWILHCRNLAARDYLDGDQVKFDAAIIDSSHQVVRKEYQVEAVASKIYPGLNYGVNRPGTELAVVADADGRPAIYDLASGVVRELDNATLVYSRKLAWSPDEKWLGVVGHGRLGNGENVWGAWFHWYDTQSATHLASKRLDPWGNTSAESIAWRPDSTRVVVGSAVGVCTIFDLASFDGQRLNSCLSKRIHPVAVKGLSWHPDGNRIASGGKDTTVNVWDSNTGDVLLKLPVDGEVTHLEWSQDGRRLAAMFDGRIRIWDAADGYEFAASEFITERFERRTRYNIKAALDAEEFSHARRHLENLLSREGNWEFGLFYELSLLHLDAGDQPGYVAIRDRMLCKFRESEDNIELYFTAWTCALDSSPMDDFAAVTEVAKRVVSEDPSNLHSRTGLGAILYRAERYEEAATELEAALAEGEDSNSSPAYTHYFLAMTHFRMGDKDSAYNNLRLANERAEFELVDLPDWNRKLTLGLLRDEATALIHAAESSR